MPLWLALIMAGAISALFALVVGLPVMRVRGPYFVILTFGLAELVKYSLMAIEAKMGILAAFCLVRRQSKPLTGLY